MANIVPNLLSEISLAPTTAIQAFTIDKQAPVAYGLYMHHAGSEVSDGKKPYQYQEIVKYSYQNGQMPTQVSTLKITDNGSLTPGHCESMALVHGSEDYLLIAVKSSGSVGGHYGTQLARVPVSMINGGSIAYDQLVRLGSMNWVGGQNIGSPARLEMALSSDEKTIALWVFDANKRSHMALYKMTDIEALFTKAASQSPKETTIKGTGSRGYSNFSNQTKTQLFAVTTPTGGKTSNTSLQGFALNNADYLIVSAESGVGDPMTTTGAKGIWKFKAGAADSGKPTPITNGHWSKYAKEQIALVNQHGGSGDAGVEGESIQIIGGLIYLAVAYHRYAAGANGMVETEKNRLYTFDKSLI